jgi:hypothetical protein
MGVWRRGRPLEPFEEKQIAEAYAAGEKVDAIAALHKISPPMPRRIALRYGVPPRGARRARKRPASQ